MTRWKTKWHKHPGVRTGDKLSGSERAADLLRNGMGSWPFVFSFLLGMVVWAVFKGPGHHDPYPYILLNLMLSTLAGLQGAIILIAAKRADQVASEEAHHTLQNTELIKDLIKQNTKLTETVHELTAQIKEHLG